MQKVSHLSQILLDEFQFSNKKSVKTLPLGRDGRDVVVEPNVGLAVGLIVVVVLVVVVVVLVVVVVVLANWPPGLGLIPNCNCPWSFCVTSTCTLSKIPPIIDPKGSFGFPPPPLLLPKSCPIIDIFS